ncbi:MAG: hypothetical protein COV74_09330 [Candidatus Omnitrophica bacterium CG11_big_fil_rev_8_21_14_0_20_45_26]|uniref:Uncharacterized protein n=1 Tax=Candidatus Abzuiibacterium crystallinum TaxID=1974748 RepID=A0A2H0LLR1_9BACT|nr:MAG: hypothetical protein COV74_09330 [Candidatus Omnitrophica bacterium CG11_big_fil_rev_8_21_14_0_20_45_26]PIW65354.1 MAG: hypothetical protein COW12_02270 [Candidatus Omnitrophica bacterium CG12_big_fil_rev_8_21_14_0_65_45_16]
MTPIKKVSFLLLLIILSASFSGAGWLLEYPFFRGKTHAGWRCGQTLCECDLHAHQQETPAYFLHRNTETKTESARAAVFSRETHGQSFHQTGSRTDFVITDPIPPVAFKDTKLVFNAWVLIPQWLDLTFDRPPEIFLPA